MKKILALSLVLAAATIAKGAVPSSIEVRRGGLVATNAGGAGLYLTSDGTNYYWALVTSSNTNIPTYVLTNNQASAATFSSDVNIATLLQVTGTGGGTGVRVAGRTDLSSVNVTNFLRNYGWFQVDGAQTNLTSLFVASGSPIYFLDPSGNIGGQVSAASLLNSNVISTNGFFGIVRVSGKQTNLNDLYVTGSSAEIRVNGTILGQSGYIKADRLGTTGNSAPISIMPNDTPSVEVTTTNLQPANAAVIGLGYTGREFTSADITSIKASTTTSTVFSANSIVANLITNSGLPTNSILRVGPGGIITTGIIGSGLSLAADGTLSATGGGGGGGAPAMSYVALPSSGIVGGTQLAYSTNLSADISVTFSNLIGTNRYFLQWLSTGQKVSFNNSGTLFFLDAGRGGYSESSTNAGVYEMQVWKDDVSGRTNALFHGREYQLAFGSGVTASTNELTGVVTVSATGGAGSGGGVQTNFFNRETFGPETDAIDVWISNQAATAGPSGNVGNGTASPGNASHLGPYHVIYTSTATSNSTAGAYLGGTVVVTNRPIRFATRTATTLTNGTQINWVGFIGYTGLSTTTNPADTVSFRYAPMGGDTQWVAYCANSGSGSQVTNINTGVSVTNDAFYSFGIVCEKNQVRYYINGSCVATNNDATTFPNDVMSAAAAAKTMTNEPVRVRFLKMRIEQPVLGQ